MAYGDFTLDDVRDRFGLELRSVPTLFPDVPPVEPSDWLKTVLDRLGPIATAISTEKARSEWLIAPIIGEVRLRFQDRLSVFSGVEFNVDEERGLRGYCDFIVARSPVQHLLTAPVVMVAEAKNGVIANGYGQAAAGMVAARMFNERKGRPISPVYGAVSTGDIWAFLQLEGNVLSLELHEYTIADVARILGILSRIASG